MEKRINSEMWNEYLFTKETDKEAMDQPNQTSGFTVITQTTV